MIGSLAVLLTCCGGSTTGAKSTTSPAPRVITAQEASVLASVLHRNLEAAGARFTASAAIDGAPVRLDGTVSWADHAGTAMLRVGSVAPYEVRWTADAVFRALPGLPERLASRGRPDVRWVVLPAEPTGRRLDVVISLLLGLAATTPDNPVNLQRQPDVQALGENAIDGRAVHVFRKGRIELWIDKHDSMLRRAMAQLAFTDSALQIDVSGFGPQPFAIPPTDEIVDGREIPDVYRELTQLSVI